MSLPRYTAQLCLAALLSLSTIGAVNATTANKVVIEHASGSTEVNKHPQRIVVLDYASLETLQLLAAPVIARPTGTQIPNTLKQYQDAKYLNAGSLFEPDFAAISAMKPDLIIIGGRSRDAYQQLSEIAPTLNMTITNKDYLAGLKQRTLQLATLFDKQSVAQQEIDKFEQRLAQIRPHAAKAGSALSLLTTGGNFSASAPGGRFAVIYDMGFSSALPATQEAPKGQRLDAAKLVALNPDWLFVIDRDAAINRADAKPASQLLADNALTSLSAIQKSQVVYLHSDAIYLSGGLTTYQQMADQVATALSID